MSSNSSNIVQFMLKEMPSPEGMSKENEEKYVKNYFCKRDKRCKFY